MHSQSPRTRGGQTDACNTQVTISQYSAQHAPSLSADDAQVLEGFADVLERGRFGAAARSLRKIATKIRTALYPAPMPAPLAVVRVQLCERCSYVLTPSNPHAECYELTPAGAAALQERGQ